jgi:putative transposase
MTDTAHAYRRHLQQHGMLASVSRRDDCWDNAPMERFFATLKAELVDERNYLTRAEVRADVFG